MVDNMKYWLACHLGPHLPWGWWIWLWPWWRKTRDSKEPLREKPVISSTMRDIIERRRPIGL